MTFVLDNSVAMRWFFEDGSASDLEYADRVLASLKEETAVVPAIWRLEVANVLARAAIKYEGVATQIDNFIQIIREMSIEVDPYTSDHALYDTLSLARHHKLTSYDASYLELALRRSLPIATLDAGLQKAARKAGVKRF